MTDQQTSTDAPDRKILDRVVKLLALSRDAGATEAEASSAAEKAAELMRAHNLSEAMLGSGRGEARHKAQSDGKAMYEYQQHLMLCVAETNFCVVTVRTEWNGRRTRRVGYNVIGRESNLVAVHVLFEYLCETITRLGTEYVGGDHTKTNSRAAISFREGVARRVGERLRERHASYLRDQERQAREARATQSHPSAAPTAGALVVVMRDYEQEERDLNNDLRYGYEPGTTAARRASGAFDVTDEDRARWAAAEAAEQVRRAGLTEAQRRREDEKKEAEARRYEERDARARERYWARRDVGAFLSGKRKGDEVSLDKQLNSDTRRLGN